MLGTNICLCMNCELSLITLHGININLWENQEQETRRLYIKDTLTVSQSQVLRLHDSSASVALFLPDYSHPLSGAPWTHSSSLLPFLVSTKRRFYAQGQMIRSGRKWAEIITWWDKNDRGMTFRSCILCHTFLNSEMQSCHEYLLSAWKWQRRHK